MTLKGVKVPDQVKNCRPMQRWRHVHPGETMQCPTHSFGNALAVGIPLLIVSKALLVNMPESTEFIRIANSSANGSAHVEAGII